VAKSGLAAGLRLNDVMTLGFRQSRSSGQLFRMQERRSNLIFTSGCLGCQCRADARLLRFRSLH
jgi:hypothetical protein